MSTYLVAKQRFRSIIRAEFAAEDVATKRGKPCPIIDLKTGDIVVTIAPRRKASR